MRAAIVALTVFTLVTSVMAQPPKVLVLPLDGNAPADQRGQIDSSVVALAKAKIGGDVTVGDTTFTETAAAVGCNPEEPPCVETVRTTLQVDELIYGSANTEDGATTVIVSRATAAGEPRSQISVIAEGGDGAQAEAGLEPLFAPAPATPPDGSATPGPVGSAAPPGPERRFFDTRERKLGVAFAAGGGIALVIGLAMWSSASDMQDDIDGHPNTTLADITALRGLEDEAAGKATWGNILVVVGLAAGGVGGYFLWRDRNNRRTATVTPAPVEAGTGMTFVLRGRW